MRFGVIVFPGSNCDMDAFHVVKDLMKVPCDMVWHQTGSLLGFDAVILPGGFSYGDYLRAGALASFSPVLGAVRDYAREGGIVVGICNGFQILVESELLPGALTTNRDTSFICKDVFLRVERTDTPMTCSYSEGDVLRMPIAHQSGKYVADPETLALLDDNRQVVFRYCDEDGEPTDQANPNGSMGSIAGIVNDEGNVLGMMPHPERASESVVGGEDGRKLFESILAYLHHQG